MQDISLPAGRAMRLRTASTLAEAQDDRQWAWSRKKHRD